MTRLGIIAGLYCQLEKPPTRFNATGEYREWLQRAKAWAGDADAHDLTERLAGRSTDADPEPWLCEFTGKHYSKPTHHVCDDWVYAPRPTESLSPEPL